MSTLSFGSPSLQPSHTEEAWFPRLESDEILVVAGLEEKMRLQEHSVRSHPFPAYVGARAPEEEDDATAYEDDDQEEKTREPHGASPPRPGEGAAGATEEGEAGSEIGEGDRGVDSEEEEEEEEEEEDDLGLLQDDSRMMSEEDPLTGDDDIDMEAEEGVEMGESEEFDFEADDNLSESADL